MSEKIVWTGMYDGYQSRVKMMIDEKDFLVEVKDDKVWEAPNDRMAYAILCLMLSESAENGSFLPGGVPLQRREADFTIALTGKVRTCVAQGMANEELEKVRLRLFKAGSAFLLSLEDDGLGGKGTCNREEVVDGLRETRTDSMGLGIIVYFPEVRYSSPDGDDEEESCEEDEDEPENEGDVLQEGV